MQTEDSMSVMAVPEIHTSLSPARVGVGSRTLMQTRMVY